MSGGHTAAFQAVTGVILIEVKTLINFDTFNNTAQNVALHYSKKLECVLAEQVILGEKDITTAEEAKTFTEFFWQMSDLDAEDYQNDIQVKGGVGLEYWLEKIMNLFIGYLKKLGFQQQWIDESNRINHGNH